MELLTRIRVGPRLMLGFGIVLAIMLAMLLIGISRLAMIQSNLDDIVQGDYAKITLLNTMRDSVRFRGIALRDVVLQEDIAFKRGELKRMREALKAYKDADATLATLVNDADGKALLEAIRKAETDSADKITQVIDASLSEDIATAQIGIRDAVRPSQITLIGQLDAMLAKLEQQSKAKNLEAAQAYRSARLLMLVLGVLAIAIGAAIALVITRSLTTPLAHAVDLAQRIANGDLSGHARVGGNDELAQLGAALERMTQSLSGLIGQVANTSREVAHSADQLTVNVRDASGLAYSQTEQIGQVNAVMSEMGVSSAEVARNADAVSVAANQTRDVAQEGNRQMRESAAATERIVQSVANSSDAISDLSQHIEQISQVTQVIRDIAEQTNLLALNAAIEAARAGEQGRGFAVVADEVRKLAERTAASTLSIRETVETVGGKTAQVVSAMAKVSTDVNDNAQVTRTTRDLLEKIVDAASQVDRLVAGIAEAAHKQTEASRAATGSIERIGQICERTSSSMHAMDSSAQALDQSANGLNGLVGRFKLA